MRRIASRLLPTMGAVVLGLCVLGVNSASATVPDATWTGSVSGGWSVAGNWSPSGAPTSPIGTLTFPLLSGCTGACYTSTDDLGTSLTANELVIDDEQPYDIEPAAPADTLTLEGNGQIPNVGLDATSAESLAGFPYIPLPIELGASQKWIIDGGTGNFALMTIADVVNSSSDTLDLDLPNDGNLNTTTLDTGALTLEDGDIGGGTLLLLPQGATDAQLPAAGVTIDDGPALDVGSPGVTSGPIDATAGTDTGVGNQIQIQTGSVPEATLAVNGDVNLGSGTAFDFSIDGNDTTPGLDASEMTLASGHNVSLNGARFGLSQGYVDSVSHDCVKLTPGTTYTLVSTTGGGTISGSYYYAVGNNFEGPIAEDTTSPTPSTFGANCNGNAGEAYINYTPTAITATIAAVPASTSAPTINGTARVGQTLSVDSNGGWSAYPAPSYSYQWLACASSTCTPISGATGSSYALTSAQQGDTVELQVTATNTLGHASADSGPVGAVTAAPATTPTLPSIGSIKSALSGIRHPSGTKAVDALIKSRSYKASFHAPSAGSLNIVWTTVVTTRIGTHKKHKTVKVAAGSAQAGGAGTIDVTMHLTPGGRTLLKEHGTRLVVAATEKFKPSGGSWVTITKKFSL